MTRRPRRFRVGQTHVGAGQVQMGLRQGAAIRALRQRRDIGLEIGDAAVQPARRLAAAAVVASGAVLLNLGGG